MIITLIVFAIVVIGIVFIVISKKTSDWDTKERTSFVGCLLTIAGIVASLFIAAAIISKTIACELNYQNVMHEKEMLEYRIEHMEENIIGNEMLYNDIVEFNNKLRNTKKWANSPWTNWFNNQDIASIDYIELNND